MKDRIKKLRRSLDMTQQEFADRIGVKRNTIGQYEIGRNEPIDAVINLICREFNVREEWLRTGEGEMLNPEEADILHQLVEKYNLSGTDYIMIKKFINLRPEARKIAFDYCLKVAAEFEGMGLNTPDRNSKEIPQQNPPMPDDDIDRTVEDYRRQLELERQAEERSEVLQKNA